MAENNRHYTREIAEWASQLRFEDIPARIVEEAKLQLTSVLASILATSRTGAGRRIAAASLRWAEPGPCSLIPGGERIEMKDAMAANAALSMALDFDDYLFSGHTGHSAVLVPLMLAERESMDGRRFIESQTIANEIEGRIGASVMVGPLNGQMWAFIHAAGAALAAGRAFGLDAAGMASALGMSLAQPSRPLNAGFMGGDSKLLTASANIYTGLLAAQFAAGGLKGPDNILEAADGFCETFSYVPIYPMLTRLGECWLSDTLSNKLYPGCAYIDATMDGVFEICREKEIDPDEIFKIDVYGSIFTVKMDELSRPLVREANTHPVTLNFYTPYNVAVGILDGELGPAQFEPARIADPKVWELARRVRVHHDISLTGKMLDSITNIIDIRYLLRELRFGSLRMLVKNVGPSSPLLWLAGSRDILSIVDEGRRALGKVFGDEPKERPERSLAKSAEGFRFSLGARVEFEMKSDKTAYEFEQEVPFGAAGWPLDERRNDVAGKFEKQALPVLGPDKTRAALDKISRLETLSSSELRSLISDCCVK
jgi:2-methylcitrate dehydratase PrpD